MTDCSRITVAVAGNPNAGKTTLFNALTGSNQKVGNYAGVTVEKIEGETEVAGDRLHVVDLPGTYSLTAFSLEEVVARNFILDEHPDVIVDVLDASNLERNLYLAIQLAEIGVPLVLALNMYDIARQRGIHIDAGRLEQLFGVPVVITVGRRGQGMDALKQAIHDVATGRRASAPMAVDYGPVLGRALAELEQAVATDESLGGRHSDLWVALKLMEGDERTMDRVRREAASPTRLIHLADQLAEKVDRQTGDDASTLIVEHRYGHAAGLMRQSVQFHGDRMTMTDAIDMIACNRLLGLLIVGLVIYVTFQLTFLLADGWTWVPWFDGWQTPTGVFAWLFESALPQLTAALPEGPLKSLIDDGIIGGVGGVIGFVPLIFFMFLLLGVIEDSGYIARIAFVLDRVLRVFGLQGKSIMSLIVSGGIAGGCAVPGVMATRTLNDERDRLTTMMVVPLMNCGAKMPLFAILVAAFFAAWSGVMMWVIVILSWVFALSAAWVIRRLVIGGEQTPFVMELPPYHLPSPLAVLKSAAHRSWLYLKKAGTIILMFNILLWAAMYFPRMDTGPFDRQQAQARRQLASALAGTGWDVAQLEAAAGDWLPDQTIVITEATGKGASWTTRLPVVDALEIHLVKRYPTGRQSARPQPAADAHYRAAVAWIDFRQQISVIDKARSTAQLEYSLAGRLGQALEPISRWAGFHWRENIALVGGVAAKEVIVSTLSTAYSLGELSDPTDTEAQLPLVRAVREEPDWTAVRAVALIVFVMLYSPCLATLSTIWRETGSWRWAAFAMGYSTVTAYVVAVLIYQAGTLIFSVGAG